MMLLEGGRQKRDKEADRGKIGEKVGYERSVLFLKSDCVEREVDCFVYLHRATLFPVDRLPGGRFQVDMIKKL